MNDTSLMEKVDSNTTPDSLDMCNNEFKDDQYADDHEDERVMSYDKDDLANIFAPNCEETLILEEESRSKLDKELIKKYSSNHVSKTTLKESVGSYDMIHNYYLEEAKKKAQLQKDKALNSKPSVITHARLSNTASGRKPKPSKYNQQTRNWPPSMSSRVTNKAVHIAEKPRNQNPFLKTKDLACPTCKKCIYTANHDACILKYLSKCSIWEALRGNTHDLDSIWEDKGQDCKFTRSGFKNMHTMPGDGVTIPSDAVRTYKRQCQGQVIGTTAEREPTYWNPVEMRRIAIGCWMLGVQVATIDEILYRGGWGLRGIWLGDE
ncbi:hypothetical protein Tco_1067164 [Tanacetum coccineum]|uniref:Uncharacterized protein n=1 Tax=Tanacetum coccineum TaxID=301880 RepID=A0ABQ5HE00_9ASTR